MGPLPELAGRVAGPPERCVTAYSNDALRPADNSGGYVLLYGSGRTIYRNDLGGCRFGSNDVLVVERFGSNLCRGDIIRSVDRVSHIPGPTCVLGAFTPYSRMR